MRRIVSIIPLLLAPLVAVDAAERNYTLRGDGWFDGGNERFRRLPLREARVTVEDDGTFAVTLFVREARYLVRGRWDRRGRGRAERFDIDRAFGLRAEGSGTLHYEGRATAPRRLVLDGRTADGAFHAELTDDGRVDWNDPRDHDARWRLDLGRGDRLYADLDVEGRGNGMLRMSGVRDGEVSDLRARLRTNRDVRIELARPTRGTILGEVVEVRDNQVRVRVTEVMGVRASGELDVVLRDRETIERVAGSGGSREGSWQLDFATRGGWGADRVFDGGWRGTFESNDRGTGWLRQDIGPTMSFDRLRVRLEGDRTAHIVLEGRRQSIPLRGEWRNDGRDVRIDLVAVNDVRARGRLVLERSGSMVVRLEGDGRTDRGRFELRFTR